MLEELQRRNYTADTIRGYILAVERFRVHFDGWSWTSLGIVNATPSE